jgi:TonB family protein
MSKPVFCALVVFLLVPLAFSQTHGDSPAKLLKSENYKISAEDEAAGISGTIKLAVEISKTGAVKDVTVFSAPEWPCSRDRALRMQAVLKAAEATVRKYTFSPAIKDGKPVDSRLGVSMRVGRAAREADENVLNDREAGGPRQLSSGVINGKALSLPAPIYPAEVKRAGVSGTVKIEVIVNEEGKVISAEPIDGRPELRGPSRAAACAATFAPTLLAGRPVKVKGVIVYNFQLAWR